MDGGPLNLDAVATLEDGLARAANRVRAAGVRAAAAVAAGRAAWTVGGTAAVVGAVVAVGRLAAAPPAMAAVWVGAIGLVASSTIAGVTVAVAWRRRPDPSDVAERLDLASADHNAVATALDLARSGERSPFAGRAIDAGVGVLRAAGQAPPVVTRAAVKDRRGWAAVAVGGVALAVAIWVPVRPVVRVAAVGPHDARADLALPRPLPGDARHAAPVSRPPVPADAPPPGPTAPSRTPASPGPSTETKPAAGQASESAAGSSGNAAQVAGTPGGAPSPKRSGEGRAAAPGGDPSDPARPPDDVPGRPPEMAALGAAAADAAQSRGAPRGGSAGPGDPEDKASPPSERGSGGGGPQGPPRDAKGAGKPKGGGENGSQTGSGGGAAIRGNLGGRSMSSSLDAGGSGQSGGQNAPKKSRGVAPLLLGTPAPDLFQGRPLAGPDERTRLQVAPRPVAGEPDAAAAAAPRRDDEPAVPVFRVPADSRHLVDDYFERFHGDTGPPPAVPAR